MPEEIDPTLIGYWLVIDWQIAKEMEGKVMTVIGGKPGELVEFTEEGVYIVHMQRARESVAYYRARAGCSPAEFDLFMRNPDVHTHGIYQLDGEELTLCVSADSRPRPLSIEQEDRYAVRVRYQRARPRCRARVVPPN